MSGAATLDSLNINCDKVLTLTNKSKSKVTVASAIELVNASARENAISIKGNKLNNSIVGGAGNDKIWGSEGNDSILGGSGNDSLSAGAGNDSLNGGKGNDKLWGGTGADTFIYDSGDGKDIIYGFDNTDMLKITGAVTGTANAKGTEVYFKVGSTAKAITLKNFTATTFNVNGDAYHISGKKLVK